MKHLSRMFHVTNGVKDRYAYNAAGYNAPDMQLTSMGSDQVCTIRIRWLLCFAFVFYGPKGLISSMGWSTARTNSTSSVASNFTSLTK